MTSTTIAALFGIVIVHSLFVNLWAQDDSHKVVIVLGTEVTRINKENPCLSIIVCNGEKSEIALSALQGTYPQLELWELTGRKKLPLRAGAPLLNYPPLSIVVPPGEWRAASISVGTLDRFYSEIPDVAMVKMYIDARNNPWLNLSGKDTNGWIEVTSIIIRFRGL
jgi:hypothetical protein